MRKKFLKNITFFISSLVLVVAILFSFVQIKGNQGSNTASAAVTKYEQTDGLVSGLEANEGSLSTAFDLSAYYPLMVENQLSSELCWAFSSSKVLETALMVQRGEYYNFSELGIAYLGYLNGNNFISDEAGDFNEFVNIMQQQGLVFENDFSNEAINDLTGIAGNSDVERYRDKVVSQKTREFSNTMLPVYLTDSAAYKSLYRQNNFDANSDFIKLIKSYIMTYGGLFGGLKQGTVSNQNLGIATYSEEINTYGDPSAGSYFPKGSTQGLGHAVCLIGWDDRYGFLALNSWGTESVYRRQFYIPYEFHNSEIRDIFYNDLAGFIANDSFDTGMVRLAKSSAEGFVIGEGVTKSAEDIGAEPLKNVFKFNETFEIEFAFGNEIIPQAVEISIFKGSVDVSDKFLLDFVNEGEMKYLKISTPENFYDDRDFFCGGTYVIRFFNNGELIGIKGFSIYTGLEISQINFFDDNAQPNYQTITYMTNTFATSTYSATYYMVNNNTIDIKIMTTYINSKNDLYAQDFKVHLYKLDGEELLEEDKLKEDFITGPLYDVRGLYLTTKTLTSYANYLIILDFSLSSNTYSGCYMPVHLKFYVSSRLSLISNYDDMENIIYMTDGGENSPKNVDRLPNYNEGYDPDMTEINLYAPTGKPNHNFMGWFDNSQFSGDPIEKLTKEYILSHPGPLVLYAKWEAVDEEYYNDTNILGIVGGNSTITYGDNLSFTYNFEAFDALFGDGDTSSNRYKIFYIVYVDGVIASGKDGTIDVSKTEKNKSVEFTLTKNELFASEQHTVTLALRILINNTHNIIQNLEQTISVNPKPLSVTYNNMSLQYDGNRHEPNLADIEVSGDHYDEDLNLSVLLHGSVSPVNAGSYQYELVFGNTNFTAQSEANRFFNYEIQKREIRLSWKTSEQYSDYPLFTYDYDGTQKAPELDKVGLVEGENFDIVYRGEQSYSNAAEVPYMFEVEDIEYRNYVISNDSVRRCYVKIDPVKITISLNSIVERVQTSPSYRQKISYELISGQLFDEDIDLNIISEGLNSNKSGVYPITCQSNNPNYIVTTVNNNQATYTLTGFYYVYYSLPNGETYTERVEEGESAKGVPADVYKGPLFGSLNYSNSLQNETGADLYVKVTETNYLWLVISVIIVVAFVVIYLVVTRKARRNKVK